ncbi:MAG: DedA family protein [Alphaproteobacteria bacterium]|nr:DedA family protein [Alphaproteobacteria bacterium]
MEFLDHFEAAVRDFVVTHRAWAGPIAFALAFGESLAFIGILVPATAALVVVGVLIGQGLLDFWVMALWAIPGAALGDWISYWIGRKFDCAIARVWPFAHHPELLEAGHRFFARWGAASVFLGRFLGPVRATIPLIAGMMDMPRIPFQIANWTSACIWAPYWLAAGVLGDRAFDWVGDYLGTWGGLALLAAIVALALAGWKRLVRAKS